MANENNFDITDIIKLIEYNNQQGSSEVGEAINEMMPIDEQGLGAHSQMDAVIALNDIKNIENEQAWGSRADSAWFPLGGKIFPEMFGDKLQMPEGGGDVMDFLATMMTGGQAFKGAKILGSEGKKYLARRGMKQLGSKPGQSGGTSVYPGSESVYPKLGSLESTVRKELPTPTFNPLKKDFYNPDAAYFKVPDRFRASKQPSFSSVFQSAEKSILDQMPPTRLAEILRKYIEKQGQGKLSNVEHKKILDFLRQYSYETSSMHGKGKKFPVDLRKLADEIVGKKN